MKSEAWERRVRRLSSVNREGSGDVMVVLWVNAGEAEGMSRCDAGRGRGWWCVCWYALIGECVSVRYVGI